tara:strand:+ start:15785 stop:16039 length:255 start_codon:yes stop_codon:yes gene_type:complete
MNIDYSKITDNPKVIELLKQRIEIENKIKAIDETVLIKHELELLSLPDVIVCSNCKFNGMQPMNDSPCDMYNASEQTCSNYNKL